MSNGNDNIAQAATPAAAAQLSVAHVLFMDIVGYSKLLFDEQTQYLERLQKVVRSTSEFAQAQADDSLISLPTGDGMALVFFDDPESPLRCAVDLVRKLKAHPDIELRIGIHSGPVYRIADINANRNVAGGGINIAQRIMDCGDAGHILLSRRVADDLGQLSRWSDYIHDLGEVTVKHGVRLHVANFYTPEVGNPLPPSKFSRPAGSSRHTFAPTILIAMLLSVFVAGAVLWSRRRSPPAPASTTPVSDGVTSDSAAAHRLEYWIVVQKYRRGQPYEAPFRLSGEINFERDYRIRMFFVSPHGGHLYLINEAPAPVDGRPDFNLLFPTPTANGGSSALVAGQQAQVPERSWLVFDQQRGGELLWIIWSPQRVEELEELKAVVNPREQGVISDPAQINSVRTLLSRAAESRATAEKDVAGALTRLTGKGALLIYPIRLEHH